MRELDAMLECYRATEEREDRRAAMLAAILANAHRDDKKRREPFDIEDFMPGQRREVQGPGPMDLCPECKTPRWRGHLASCETGRKHFAGQVGGLKEHHKEVKEKLLQQGRKRRA